MTLDFLTENTPSYGIVEKISPMVQRVVAKNPSKFTYFGTGTYIIGNPNGTDLAVIDPGPADDDHLSALLTAIGNRTVSHILITHTHSDHSPAAEDLKRITSAPTYGFGPHPTLERKSKERGHDASLVLNEESSFENQENEGDINFVPDLELTDGDVLTGHGFTFEVLHTPGHISNHLCFALEEESTLFTGDHVMGWSTTVIPAPDGNLSHYMKNLRRLLERREKIFRPTHGPSIKNPIPFVKNLINHRENRTEQILAAIKKEPKTVGMLVTDLYSEIDKNLHKAAAGSVYAHLIDLARIGIVAAEPDISTDAEWKMA